MSINFILIVLASVCFFLAAIKIPKTTPIHFGWLGAFIFTLTFLIK